jgi:hypothetical protein
MSVLRFLVYAVAPLACSALTPCCTLAHPLDEYHAGPAAPADAAGGVRGATIRLTASAPRCITAMILYVDGVETLHFATSSVDQDLPIAVGSHTLNINGWAGTAQPHLSPQVQITRPK